MKSTHTIGVVLVCISAIAFSMAGLFTKGVSAEAWSVIFWRGVSAAAFTFVYVIWRGGWAVRSGGSGGLRVWSCC